MAVTAFVTVVAFVIALASMVAGAWLGVRLARGFDLAPPAGAPTGACYEIGFRVAVLCLRLFVVITGMLIVSTPVGFVLAALLTLT